MAGRNTIVLIPAYEPGKRLLELVDALKEQTDYEILLVDDGSGEKAEEIFGWAAARGCTLLTHEKNRGKGAALKTGFAYLKENGADGAVIVTADCDGQHTAGDIVRVAQAVEEGSREMILGSRTFEGEVPRRSRIGNTLSRGLFTLFTGLKIWDTQTGLRGFPASMLDWLLRIPGERFEYEQNMLFESRRQGYTIREIPIETIYENQNSGTHFHAVRDSLLVALCFWRFSAVSVCCAVLDFFLIGVFFRLSKNLLFSVIATRLCTASLQYLANHFLVFQEKKEEMKGSSLRYALLAVSLLALNYLGLDCFTAVFGLSLFAAKLLTELLLFLLSFGLQKTFVFRRQYSYNG